MGLPPDKVKPITLSDLVRLGALHIDIRGVEFDPPMQNRGPDKNTKVKVWQATITHKDSSKPLVRAIREDIEEADRDVRSRFVAIMGLKSGESVAPISDTAKKVPQKKREVKIAVDDTDDMI